jgi:hypothetical protein
MDENHFLSANDAMVEYLTAQVDGAFRRQEESYETVREGSQWLLSLLVAGIGATSFWLIGAADGAAPGVLAGMSVLSVGWFLCAGFLLKYCIGIRERPTGYGYPSDLYSEDAQTGTTVILPRLRRLRIFYREEALRQLIALNRQRARALERARWGCAAVPVIGMIVAAWARLS